jgi:hypothetical protein
VLLDDNPSDGGAVHARYAELSDSVRASLNATVEALADALASGATTDGLAVERSLMAAFGELGRTVVREMLERLDPKGEDVSVDGTRYWQAVRATGRYMTLFGPVAVERGVYRAVRNGPTVCPMELRARIVEGFWTPQAAKVSALCVSDMTPYRAEGLFRELGIMDPSRSSLDRLPKALHARWEKNREAYEQRLRADDEIPAEAVTVAVSLDGVMVPMRGSTKAEKKAEMRRQGRADKGPAGFREVACGAISFYDAAGERLTTRRMARMPEAKQATLKEQLRRELEHVMGCRPDLTVVHVADGAANNWDYFDTLPSDHQVVDFYHAAEHLKRALDVCMGPSSVANQAKFQQLRRTLRDRPRGVHRLLRALKKLTPHRRGDHRDYRTGINYFTRHRARMRYADLQARHLPIGSGVIEGTCKSLASDRLKRAGMRWDTRGGQAVLNLRAWTQSDRFQAAWRILSEIYTAEVLPIPTAA